MARVESMPYRLPEAAARPARVAGPARCGPPGRGADDGSGAAAGEGEARERQEEERSAAQEAVPGPVPCDPDRPGQLRRLRHRPRARPEVLRRLLARRPGARLRNPPQQPPRRRRAAAADPQRQARRGGRAALPGPGRRAVLVARGFGRLHDRTAVHPRRLRLFVDGREHLLEQPGRLGGRRLQLFNQWKQSAWHNANMRDATVTQHGIGRARGTNGTWYWTTTFGRPA